MNEKCDMLEQTEEIYEFIADKTDFRPRTGLVLGSGLGSLAEEIRSEAIFGYGRIPSFPTSTAPGHAGRLVLGNLAGEKVIAMQGRFHLYEGYGVKEVALPIRVMHALGADRVVITNAAGGIRRSFQVGDLMFITDHINLMGENPLIGPNCEQWGPRFPDMSEPYSRRLIACGEGAAGKLGILTRRGVYAATVGPSYETRAEIVYMRRIGADAVGMSTVPEVIAANHMGMEVLGISCITNMAAGIEDKKLDHREVLETTERVNEDFSALLKEVLSRMAQKPGK